MQEGRRAQVVRAPASKKLLVAIAAAVVAVDQLSKAWALKGLSGGRRIPLIGETFDLRLVLNPGSAFGMFRGSTSAIFVLSLLITVGVSVWAFRDRMASPILGLIIGGGLGNLVDRLLRPPGPGRGKVIDFIYLSFWPTFNLADASICIGVGLLVLMALRESRAPA